ncbi:MAG: hypothetical protein M3Q50_02090 [Chloroflexota bacterium]|nr:hypothetical protein [Chloroflexota bacterium]
MAQTNANLRLASLFIRELLDDEDSLGVIPQGASVVLLPPDDPDDLELRDANMRMASDLAANGRNVVLWTVGMPSVTASQRLVRWPAISNAQPASITYDRDQDMLEVAFSVTKQPTLPIQIIAVVTLLIERESEAAISATIHDFLAKAAPQSLVLFDLLLLSSTRLIGITLSEVHAIRNAMVHGQSLPAQALVTSRQIVEELSALAA